MTSDDNDEVPGGYYYVPYTHGGPYETSMANIGQAAGQVGTGVAIVTTLTVLRPLLSKSESVIVTALNAGPMAGNTSAGKVGQFIGSITGSVFGEAGYMVDNIDNFARNVTTFFSELNDPNSWMAPDEGDR